MDELLALLPQELNEEAFRLCSQLLYEAGVEPLPLLIHPKLEVRIQAVYLAGKSADKRLLRKHKTNKDHIRSNIKVRLEEFAFASLEEIEREIPADWTHVRGLLKKIAGL